MRTIEVTFHNNNSPLTWSNRGYQFLKIKTPQFRKSEFVKQTLRNLERIKSALIVKDEFGLLNYDEYTSLTNKVDEVLEIISGYKNKLKEIKKTTLQKQLEVLQTEMKSL